jgi:sugar phosphate isomerase/epimerase
MHAPIVEGYTGGTWGAAISNATSDAARRAYALQETEAVLRLAGRVPYRFLVVHLGQPEDQHPPPTDNQRDAVRRSLETLDAVAGEFGVTLALEVIPNPLSQAQRLVDLIEGLELEHAGICLDFGHAHIGDDVVDAIETASGHLVTTHVHDNRGKTDDHLVPFEGRIDWDQALFAMRKIGYEGAWMFELGHTGDPADVLRRAERACARFRDILIS